MSRIINFKDVPVITGIYAVLASVGFPIITSTLSAVYTIPCIILMLIISIIVTIIYNKFNRTVKIKLTNGKLTIKYGDLWNSEGIIIVPVNTTFDTVVNKEMVSERTLHGQFIKKIFANDQKSLKKQINAALKNKESYEKHGRSNYPVGTIVPISKDGKDYYLLALSTFNNENHAELSIDEYSLAISKLLEYINLNSQGKTISMPIIGSGSSRCLPNKENALDLQISLIKNLDSVKNDSDLHIIIKEDEDIIINHHKYRAKPNSSPILGHMQIRLDND